MATLEDIMLTISATDNASSVFQGIGANAQSMASSATQAINSMNSGLMNLSNVTNNIFSKLSQGKSASDLIFGTTSKAETNAVLVNMMSETAEAAENLNKHVDDVTNTSLVSMQNLIPALNAFKTATGATDAQIYDATEGIAAFGAKVLAQTGSVELSEQAMMDLSKGIKGACASLDQYGITVDALKATGLWSGEEDDIEGYIAAVQQLTGDTSELMETNEGLDARIGKAFSSAGKKIGNEFLPQIKDVKQAFLDLNSATGGDLAASIIVAAEGIDIFSQGMMFAAQTSQGIQGIADGFHLARDAISEATDWLNKFRAAEEAASAAEIAGGLSGVSPEAIQEAAAFGGANVSFKNSPVDINDAEMLQDMIDYQVASAEGSLSKMAVLEEKYDNMNLSAIALKSESEIVAETVGDIPDTKGISKISKTTEEVVESASGMGKVGPKAAVAGAEMEASAGGLSAISAGASSMLVPLLSIAVVIAVMIPVVTALAAEALLCMKGIQLLVDALDFGSVDLEDDLKGIKQINEVLLNIGIAMGAMTFAGIMTGANLWVTGLFMIVNPIQVAVDQLKTVIPIVNELGEIEPINENIPDTLNKFSESMKLVSEAMNTMTTVTGVTAWAGFIAWVSGLGTVTSAIKRAKEEITTAAKEISGFTDLPEIDEGVVSKLKSTSESLKSVADAMKALQDLNWTEITGNLFGNTDVVHTLLDAKQDIVDAATAISEFTDLPEIPSGVAGKLKSIADALKSVQEATSALADINWAEWTGNLFGNADYVGNLRSAKQDIEQAAREIATLNNLQDIPEGTATKVTRVADATKMVGNALSQMQGANIPNIVSLAILPVRISIARGVLQNTANQLIQLQGIPQVSDLSGKLNNLSTGSRAVSTAVSSINAIPSPGLESGLKIQMAVATIKKAATELNQLSGSNVNVSGVLGSVRNAMNQLKATLAAMGGGFMASSIGIGAGIKAGVVAGLTGLSGEVNSQASSAMATFNATMTTGGTTAGNSARTAFQGSFKLADIARAEMNYAVQAVNSGSGALADACRRAAEQAVQAARDGADSHSPGAIARMWGQEIGEYSVEKVKSGASLLVRTVRNISRDVVNAWGSPSLDIGNNIGALSTFNPGNLRNMGMLSQMIPAMGGSNKTIIFNVEKGAWQLDARNLTEKECQKIVTLGLEGLTQVSDVNIRGI